MILHFRATFHDAGDPSVNSHLYSKAWDECIELQVMDKQAWVQKSLATLTALPRCELGVFLGDLAVGGLVLAYDDDIHVGPCMAVVAQYVLPEYRNKGVSIRCMRSAMDITKRAGYKMLAFTHRLGDWRYETIYRPIK